MDTVMTEYADTMCREHGFKIGSALAHDTVLLETKERLMGVATRVALAMKVADMVRVPDYDWKATCDAQVTEAEVARAYDYLVAMDRLGVKLELPASVFWFEPSWVAVKMDRAMTEVLERQQRG